MEKKNSSEDKPLQTESNDPAENFSVTGNGYKLGHDLTPEEAARTIWVQWLTINRLVNAEDFRDETE